MTRAERDARWADLDAQEARISLRLAEAALYAHPHLDASARREMWDAWTRRAFATLQEAAEPVLLTAAELYDDLTGWFRRNRIRG